MEDDITRLARQDINVLQPYQSARTIGGQGHIFLNANESPLLNCISVNNLILNRYPECQPEQLITNYSAYSGINKKNILVCRGADEGIELLMRVFCTPGQDIVITCPPTYTMYAKLAEIYGIENIKIPMIQNKKLNFSKIVKHIKRTKLIYLCRPNNPTGYVINVLDIVKVLEITKSKAIVVIDEAYIEFCIEKNLVNLLHQYNHLVILRTLSKAFGLAGIRCGFILAGLKIIDLLKKIIAPYPLSTPSIYIASRSLDEQNIFTMKERVYQLNQNRNFLVHHLKKNSIVKYIFSSEANYILVKFINSSKIFNMLWKQGIILRNQDHEIQLSGCIRISIGTQEECINLITALKRISLH